MPYLDTMVDSAHDDDDYSLEGS